MSAGDQAPQFKSLNGVQINQPKMTWNEGECKNGNVKSSNIKCYQKSESSHVKPGEVIQQITHIVYLLQNKGKKKASVT